MADLAKSHRERLEAEGEGGEWFSGTVDGIVRFAVTNRPVLTPEQAADVARQHGLSAAEQALVRKRVAARPK